MKITKGKLIKRIVIIFICAVILIFCIGSFFAVKSVFRKNFERRDISYFTAFLRFDDIEDIKKLYSLIQEKILWSDMFSAVKTVMDWL